MGYASRANKHRTMHKETIQTKPIKVHIPNSNLDLIDGIFMGMFKGLRPITSEERKEAISQGIDMRPPDERERERQFQIQKEKPEVKIILTDA